MDRVVTPFALDFTWVLILNTIFVIARMLDRQIEKNFAKFDTCRLTPAVRRQEIAGI